MHTGIHTGFLLEKALACFYQVLPDKCPGFYNCLAHWMQRPFKYLDENTSVGLLRVLNTFGNAQRWSELSSVLHILLNAMGASFCYIGLTELTEKGSWLLLRATVTSYLFRKCWRAGNIFSSPSLNSKQLMWVTTTPHFWGFLLGPVNRIGFINYHGKAAGEEIQMD